jgi:hypothetical protein
MSAAVFAWLSLSAMEADYVEIGGPGGERISTLLIAIVAGIGSIVALLTGIALRSPRDRSL